LAAFGQYDFAPRSAASEFIGLFKSQELETRLVEGGFFIVVTGSGNILKVGGDQFLR